MIERVSIGGCWIWVDLGRTHLDRALAFKPIDLIIAEDVLVRDAYRLRPLKESGFNVRSFLDIGANIGAVTVLVRELFNPKEVTCIEPVANFFEVLSANIGDNGRHIARSVGFDFGGVNALTWGEIADLLPVDLIKTDCEGGEGDLFRFLSSRRDLLDKVGVIVGECHGPGMFELAKEVLGQTHNVEITTECPTHLEFGAKHK